MHIPDPAYAVAAGLWSYGLRRIKKDLDEKAIPYLAVMTGLSFVLMMVSIPLPGGTSVHAAGIGLLAVLFGVWITFLSVSMVLLLQAVLFADGGITSLPINALSMGLVGGAIATAVFSMLRRVNTKAALFAAGWVSINAASVLVAVALGVQPVIAHAADGTPLFFPFSLSVTLPAILVPHAVIGIGEGFLTIFVYGFVSKQRNQTT